METPDLMVVVETLDHLGLRVLAALLVTWDLKDNLDWQGNRAHREPRDRREQLERRSECNWNL